MKKPRTVAVLIGLALGVPMLFGLSKCKGPYLGAYRFENARLVDWAAFDAVDPELHAEPSSSDLLRIEFSSETDLAEASGGAGLYVHADFCPFSDEYRIWVLGPYYNDRSPYALLNRTERRLPDGSTAIDGDRLHPSRDPRTNRYVYTAYVPSSQPARNGPEGEAREAYDLRASTRDLCLRIDHPGYFITRSRSDTFVIPGAAIAAALRQASGPR